jgi:hypothetical protein
MEHLPRPLKVNGKRIDYTYTQIDFREIVLALFVERMPYLWTRMLAASVEKQSKPLHSAATQQRL